jgi:hypothetical protein
VLVAKASSSCRLQDYRNQPKININSTVENKDGEKVKIGKAEWFRAVG